MIRVGVIGATGRMGGLVCRAVARDPQMELAAAVSRSRVGEDLAAEVGAAGALRVTDDLDELARAGVQVAVDFTRPDVVMDDVRWSVRHAVHVVVGTSGVGRDELAEIGDLLERQGGRSGVVVVPNFAIGAVLMQRFAEAAARYLPSVEIVELHHDGKVDAPSGTAIDTAIRVARARGEAPAGPASESVPGVRGGEVDGVRIHSVRLPGLVAHQEVILGGPGQTLTIRHDAPQRESYMPGVLLAIRSAPDRPGLTVGLEALLQADGA